LVSASVYEVETSSKGVEIGKLSKEGTLKAQVQDSREEDEKNHVDDAIDAVSIARRNCYVLSYLCISVIMFRLI